MHTLRADSGRPRGQKALLRHLPFRRDHRPRPLRAHHGVQRLRRHCHGALRQQISLSHEARAEPLCGAGRHGGGHAFQIHLVEEAVDSLTNALSRAIQEKAGKIIRPFDLMTAIEQGKNNILVGGKALDIGGAMGQAVASIADVIVDESNRLLNNLPPDAWIERVIVCGGGAYVFGDYLKQAFFEANIVKSVDEVLMPENAVMSNARGFEQIALTKLKK